MHLIINLDKYKVYSKARFTVLKKVEILHRSKRVIKNKVCVCNNNLVCQTERVNMQISVRK